MALLEDIDMKFIFGFTVACCLTFILGNLIGQSAVKQDAIINGAASYEIVKVTKEDGSEYYKKEFKWKNIKCIEDRLNR